MKRFVRIPWTGIGGVGVRACAALSLALSVSVMVAALSWAQVGPPAPQEKAPAPAPKEAVKSFTDKFVRMFKPGEDPQAASADPNAPAPPPAPTPANARPPLLSQPPLENAKVVPPVESAQDPPRKLPALDNPKNPFGLADAEKRLNETAQLIEKKDYGSARAKLTPLKEWLMTSTEAHISIYKALSNVPAARVQSELEKQVALEFAKMRDKAFFQMGKILIAEQQPQEAIKLLTEVIKSQPRSEMGMAAYETLQEMGFTQKLQLLE
ncbi:MAG: hypothetical protein IPK79_05575 [Vampirovibrionales bacterium]|nr:hypothetical protein [Vampirovibrionales bacterium]